MGDANDHVFIVMPVYNRERYLRRSVESIINQKHKNWTLMIVDDNSTDGSSKIIDELQSEDGRIISKLNSDYSHSAAGARMSGLEDADAPYIAFLDSDDTWSEHHLSDFIQFMRENDDVDLVFGDLRRIDVTGNEITKSKFKCESGLPKDIKFDWDSSGYAKLSSAHLFELALIDRFTIGLHSTLYRAKVLEDCPLIDISTGEDFMLTLQLIKKEHRIACHNRIHLNYLVHSSNTSNSNKDADFKKRKDNFENERLIYEFYIPRIFELSDRENKCRRLALSRIYVWLLGNSLYREAGHRAAAIKCILKGISLEPYNFKYWKTLFGALVK